MAFIERRNSLIFSSIPMGQIIDRNTVSQVISISRTRYAIEYRKRNTVVNKTIQNAPQQLSNIPQVAPILP